MKCHHALRQVATGISSREEINVSPVPLFLVPQAVAGAIRRHGRAVREVHVRRTRNHQYTVTVERGAGVRAELGALACTVRWAEGPEQEHHQVRLGRPHRPRRGGTLSDSPPKT